MLPWQANALMAGGQTLGLAVMGTVSGALLPAVGLGTTSLVCALGVLPALLLILGVLERPGERYLPECAARCLPGGNAPIPELAPLPVEASLKDKAADVVRGLLNPSIIFLLIAVLLGASTNGIGEVVWAAVALERGISAKTFALVRAATALVAALAGMAVSPYFDAIGTRPMFIGGLVGFVVTYSAVAVLGDTLPLTGTQLMAGVCFAGFAGQFLFIAFIAKAMALCADSLAAATQFAAIMAVNNLSGTIGAAIVTLKLFDKPIGHFPLMAGMAALAIIPISLVPDKIDGKKKPTDMH